jgi:hypothetical protein
MQAHERENNLARQPGKSIRHAGNWRSKYPGMFTINGARAGKENKNNRQDEQHGQYVENRAVAPPGAGTCQPNQYLTKNVVHISGGDARRELRRSAKKRPAPSKWVRRCNKARIVLVHSTRGRPAQAELVTGRFVGSPWPLSRPRLAACYRLAAVARSQPARFPPMRRTRLLATGNPGSIAIARELPLQLLA